MQLTELVQEQPYLKAKVIPMEEVKPAKGDEEFDALVSSIKDIALQIVKESPNIPTEAQWPFKISSHLLLNQFCVL